MVYEQCIYKDNVEYLFKNGEVIDNVAFVERFIKELNLCENDICIMDRAGYLDYIQPLFENKGKSKLIAVLHSDHFYKIYEDESSLYMNYEYYYWFKYSEAIDYFVVGTDEHKRSLEAFLKEYDCFVPHIAAIPPGAIPEGKLKSKNNRWQGSIISASRLSPRKGIDILIKSAIKAHEINQTINLDIYGSGNDEYTSYLQNIVKDAGADDYIHFKGQCNLEKIYPHYELFASFSLWETFGLGFDFLFDNLVKKKEDRFLCDFHYVIIDEADSVLLDSAIMPLVISGVPRVQSNLYDVCDFFVTTLVEDIDYIEEDKAVWLTPKGVKFAESFFGISNFYGKENFEINRHVTLSLRAHKLLKNKKDYVVTDKKEVELFDGATGRLMHGVKLRGGQHQAIEAKEKVEISQEYRTVASVTFQNLFMMFDKMAGMSGTLMDAKDELFETYGKQVVKIPTNRPLKRVDRKDRYFKNGHDQFWTAVDDVIRLHETGQPVLVVLNSVTDTDLFSRLLIEKNIPHNVLNASNAFWEAQIIAGAGQLNAVTVATTMAGRGTDIKLGDGVKELGGLAVIGIGRMNNSRSERQARGRAGRQGDPGFSQYYVSLEDDIVGAEDDDKLQRYIDGKKRIGKRKIKRIVNQCQKLSVESEEMNRKKSLQYDQVLQRQRDLIYATRKKLLDGASVEQEKIVEIAKENISDFVNHFDCIQSNKKHGRRRGRKKDSDKNTNTQQYTSMLNRYILDNISYKLDAGLTLSDMQSAATVSDYLMLRVYQGLSRQRERIGDEEAYEQFVREATLKAVDDGWVELIDYLEQLKYAVAGRASAQRNVMFEYQNEAFESFLDTEKAVKCNIIRNILLSDVKIGKDGRLQVIYP